MHRAIQVGLLSTKTRWEQWRAVALTLAATCVAACNVQSGKNHYVLAERLFGDRKYAAAVQEFQKIIESDPQGVLAQQALFRVGMIEMLYLNAYADAVRSFRQFTSLSRNTKLVFQAEKNTGEILLLKLEEYRPAVEQYRKLLEKYPESQERDFFLLRLAKAYYGALDFQKSIDACRELVKRYPKSELVQEALYQIGNTLFTRGDCDEAVKVFREVVEQHAQSRQAMFAGFGMANCFEELEKPGDALMAYRSILDRHPSRLIVEAKIRRLSEKQRLAEKTPHRR